MKRNTYIRGHLYMLLLIDMNDVRNEYITLPILVRCMVFI